MITGLNGCGALTRKGEPCNSPASKSGSGFCVNHDPAQRVIREARNSKGGKKGNHQRRTPSDQPAPDLSTRKGILDALTFEAVGLAGEQISVSRARAMSALCMAAASILHHHGYTPGEPVGQIKIFYNLAETEEEVGEYVGGVHLPYNNRDPIPDVPNAVAPTGHLPHNGRDEVIADVEPRSRPTEPAGNVSEPAPAMFGSEETNTEPTTNGDESPDLTAAAIPSRSTPPAALSGGSGHRNPHVVPKSRYISIPSHETS